MPPGVPGAKSTTISVVTSIGSPSRVNGLYRQSLTAFVAAVSSAGSPEIALMGETPPDFRITARTTTVDAFAGPPKFCGYVGLTIVMHRPAISFAGTLSLPCGAPAPLSCECSAMATVMPAGCIALDGAHKTKNMTVATSDLEFVSTNIPPWQVPRTPVRDPMPAVNVSGIPRPRPSKLQGKNCSPRHSSSN
jgi:hypothetical protein